jgi:hypothetical protein
MHARLPELASIRAADAQANVTHGAGLDAMKPANIADREYFTRLRDSPDSGLVISEPLIGRISGKPVMAAVRRVNAPDGSFAGAIYGTIPLDLFTRLFATVDL